MTHSTGFSAVSISRLFQMIGEDYRRHRQIFGIPEALFFKPAVNGTDNYGIFGHQLRTPFGVAAGPHTQLAQNIVSAWLCGASYIELKTVQTLDELEITKPCIDMQDEGYNCEWSQELRIHESFGEYLKAWILIHLLHHRLGHPGVAGGFIFNMSVGYNLQGILSENVQWFLSKMQDCRPEKEAMISSLLPLYPELRSISIPDRISSNITLSTMHGCPPGEIEKIGHYLLTEKKLHTFIKLNPTLLGKEQLREILNNRLGYKTIVPDAAFEHDLQYEDALGIIRRLQLTAGQNNLTFGVKLTNTLECLNHRNILPPKEEMMYMSGRALHPISVNVAARLRRDLGPGLHISFSGGADCFNISNLLQCGLMPVTVCSDLLKPGGYGRLQQYIEQTTGLNTADTDRQAMYLEKYALSVVDEMRYRYDPFSEKSIKTARPLGLFDCIHAPCVDECPTNQDIPEYLRHISKGETSKALDVIFRKNPFPNVLGSACDHPCQLRCTRINYDQPLQIRELKLFAAHSGKTSDVPRIKENGKSAAVIGAGPSGLSFAYFMRLAGFRVEIFESHPDAGGMVRDAIPPFRMKAELLMKDVERIRSTGVIIHFNTPVNRPLFGQLRDDFDYVYIAAGARRFKTLPLEGAGAGGVVDPLTFLKLAKAGKKSGTGRNILVIGGGNTAMDVARTARRIAEEDAAVSLVYRRSRAEMPASQEEIEAALHEGVRLLELLSPEQIHLKDGHIVALSCAKMKLITPADGGRAVPFKTDEPLITLPADTLIPALGQETDIDFATPEELSLRTESDYETQLDRVYIGGDAIRGAATIVKAVGDGRRAAAAIAASAGITLGTDNPPAENHPEKSELIIRKSRRININPAMENTPPLLTADTAREEALRCLQCDTLCNICVTVCPNRANISYQTPAVEIPRWKMADQKNGVSFEQSGTLKIEQSTQVLNLAGFCNECGNCTTFCPSSGAPFRDKPRFCLSGESFNKTDNGYMLLRANSRLTLLHRQGDQVSRLIRQPDSYLYETENMKVAFDLTDFRPYEAEIKNSGMINSDLSEASTLKFFIDNPDITAGSLLVEL
ncbi:putative oxidoreductase YgfK [anaerobic digester metagenome]